MFAEVNGTRLYYEVCGSGEPLLLLAGLGGEVSGWHDLIDEIKGFELVAFDNRGSGKSDKPTGGYSCELMSRDTAALMEHLDIRKAHVLGASMGGMIAQHLAIGHPDKVHTLILSSTMGFAENYTKRNLDIMGELATRLPREEFVKSISLWHYSRDFFKCCMDTISSSEEFYLKRAQQPLHAFMGQLEACRNHDTRDLLHRIKAYTLVITGSQDLIAPPECSTMLSQKIPNSKLVILRGGHALRAESNEMYRNEVLNFMTAHPMIKRR